MMTRKEIAIGIAVAVFVLSGIPLRAAHQATDEKIWKEYVSSRTDFEKNVHDLVITKWPAEKDVAKDHLKLELERLDMKTAQFEYLNTKHPDRITRDKSIDDFVAFDWSNADDKALRAKDKSYNKQAQEVAELENRYNTHASKGKFEDHLEDVKDSMEYRSFNDKYNTMVSNIGTSLKRATKNIQKKM